MNSKILEPILNELDFGTYYSKEQIWRIIEDIPDYDKMKQFETDNIEKIECLVGYLRSWLNGNQKPKELEQLIEEVELYTKTQRLENENN